MKVRPLEKDVYNYIQKCEILPFDRISAKFGQGNYALYSPYNPNAITAAALSSELYDALFLLRFQGNIFEVAVPPEMYTLLNGRLPSIPSIVPTIGFKKEKYRYGYQGPSWLPVLYCSEKGLRNLTNLYFDVVELPVKRKPVYFNEIDRQLSGPFDERRIVSFYVSELLAGMFSQPFRKQLDTKLKLIEKTGYTKFKKMLEQVHSKKQKKKADYKPFSELRELHPALNLN